MPEAFAKTKKATNILRPAIDVSFLVTNEEFVVPATRGRPVVGLSAGSRGSFRSTTRVHSRVYWGYNGVVPPGKRGG